MSWTVGKASGYMAVAMAGFYGTGALVAAALSKADLDLLVSPAVVAPYWGSTLGFFFAAVVDNGEHTEGLLTQLVRRPFHGIEFYRSAARFLPRLAELTVGAETIATLNLSPPKGWSGPLDTYFREVHAYISRADTPLESFRSLATVENRLKADWLVDRAGLFVRNPRVSLGILPGASRQLLGFHVVVKDGHGYVAIYPPISASGWMNAAIIANDDLARMLLELFEIVWRGGTVVLDGGNPTSGGLDVLKRQGANRTSPHFTNLASAISNAA